MGSMETALTTSTIQAPVYQSIGLEEFGRLLRKFGYVVAPHQEDEREGYRILVEPRFTALLRSPLQHRPGEFRDIFLYAYADLSVAISAAALQALRKKSTLAHLDLGRHGRLAATHAVFLAGGVTEYYLRNQLWYWKNDLQLMVDEVKKQITRHAGLTLH
jgi:hypothetical protein